MDDGNVSIEPRRISFTRPAVRDFNEVLPHPKQDLVADVRDSLLDSKSKKSVSKKRGYDNYWEKPVSGDDWTILFALFRQISFLIDWVRNRADAYFNKSEKRYFYHSEHPDS